MTMTPLSGIKSPLYDESELAENQDHWYRMFDGRGDFHELLMEHDDTADEITSSEYAMRATMHLDLEESQ